MALTKMLHIADPRHLLEQLQKDGNRKEYEQELYSHRLDAVDALRAIFGGLTIKEEGSLGSGGVFVPVSARNGSVEDLEEFLKDSAHFSGVSIREVA